MRFITIHCSIWHCNNVTSNCCGTIRKHIDFLQSCQNLQSYTSSLNIFILKMSEIEETKKKKRMSCNAALRYSFLQTLHTTPWLRISDLSYQRNACTGSTDWYSKHQQIWGGNYCKACYKQQKSKCNKWYMQNLSWHLQRHLQFETHQ